MARRVKRKARSRRYGRLRISVSDPFVVIGKIPKGVSYQWQAQAILGDEALMEREFARALESGWRPVPADRHPKMPRDAEGRIVVDDQVLLERDEALTAAARNKENQAAVALANEAHDSHDGKYAPSAYGGHGVYQYVGPTHEHSRQKEFTAAEIRNLRDNLKIQSGKHYVEITIGVVIDDHEFDLAVNAMALEPQEYIRRRIHMDTNVLVLVPTNRDYVETPLFRRGEMFVKAEPMEKEK